MENKVNYGTDTLVQHCYEHLQDAIILGTLKPGQKLKIHSLKELLGTGQSPIREALSRLVASGLVETSNNRGFFVATVDETDIRDTYHTFTQIETMALVQAIERGDDAWEAAVVGALHQLGLIEKRKEAIPYPVWAEKNYAFHVALISGCNSPTLLKIRHDLYLKFDRYCRIAFNSAQEDLALNHEEHKELAQAALNRDVKKAQSLMDHHINGALETVIKNLKKNNVL